jgi:probable phosphoglycerate mutase
MTTVYLTRHGQTEWNLEGRSQGHLNSNLTDLGKTQAKWLGKRLQNVEFDVVYTSTSGRTIETEEIIMQDKKVPVIRHEGLCEMHFGSWQGQLWDDVKKNEEERYTMFWENPSSFIPDCGESYVDFIKRISDTLDSIIQSHIGETILIVAHGGVLKAIFTHLEKLSIDEFWTQGPYMHSANLSIIEYDHSGYKISLKGCIDHYPEDEKNKYY